MKSYSTKQAHWTHQLPLKLKPTAWNKDDCSINSIHVTQNLGFWGFFQGLPAGGQIPYPKTTWSSCTSCRSCMSKPEALEHLRLKHSTKRVNNWDTPHLLFSQLFRKLFSSFLSKKRVWKRGRTFLLCSSILGAHQVTWTLQTPRIRLKLDANVSFPAVCI